MKKCDGKFEMRSCLCGERDSPFPREENPK